MAADVTPSDTRKHRRTARATGSASRSLWSRLALLVGAFAFLFPFYYMVIGSLQKEPDSSPSGAFPDPGNLSLHNYAAINSAISLGRSLVNSGIFTGGVIVCTTVFGLLAGYALARLQFRGRGTTFALVLLVQVIPFQLLMIPLYVLIVRDYGLADSYLGMILPFAINTTAVFIFRQFFLQLPPAMFEAARMDGAGELQILFRIALPLCKPALLSVVLLSFTGPWNEFLWPFLVTKRQDMQPLAVSLANYISTVASAAANPFGAILAGACVLAAPAVALYIVFQRRFTSTDIDSATKG
ncbi:carbohydrate ABC transporter permease [Streptomyces sp. NPDC093228]|uniref:carbohydrate ABC transporter permease n=1 Tax=unclassified Streptomyces TaxID=2593676 RepID=UPI00099EBE57|nr:MULTISPECIES: carbohydrate ABC transporter permease [unclassified Streptomyces]MDX3260982.1 carbohydrate ABC transporter permease [Streptomyces sp. MI02-2A]REE64724.1 carbohydrate ABC transporter membrane protein 2 (CUT1 family) [Streptomyces sp. 3212.3]